MKNNKFPVLVIVLLCCVCTTTKAQSNTRSSDSFTFAFITDTHLDFKGNTLKYFDKAILSINNLKPDFVITGGDNILDATRSNEAHADSLFGLYLSQVSRFDMPVYTGIGNHESFGTANQDISADNHVFGKKMYESKIGSRYYLINHKGWKFFMMDGIKISSDGSRYIGYIDEEQIGWLKKELSSTDTLMPIVVCSHIPFISSYKKFELGSLSGNPENDGISNSIQFFNLFEHHNLKLVVQGHFHFLEVLYANDVYYVTGPSLTARWGNIFTRKSGFFLFNASKDNLTWKFIENKL